MTRNHNHLKLLYGMKDEETTLPERSLDDLAGWIHSTLWFYLKRYEGDEITTRESVYPMGQHDWLQIRNDPELLWCKEWLMRVAEQIARDFQMRSEKK